MKPMFSHRSVSETQHAPDAASSNAADRTPPDSGEFYACCCPAKPIVRVTMPPSPSRPHPVDLLLCGHHYRVSRAKLETSGAGIEEFPGHAADVAAALFQQASTSVTATAENPVS